jgi:ribosomal protein L31E
VLFRFPKPQTPNPKPQTPNPKPRTDKSINKKPKILKLTFNTIKEEMSVTDEIKKLDQTENQITIIDPEFDEEIFTRSVKKMNHKFRVCMRHSKQHPKYMLYTDPQTNTIFILQKKGLRTKGWII